MNLYKLTSSSITRSIIYPLLVAESIHFGTTESADYIRVRGQYLEAIDSDSNLARVLEIEDHIKSSRIKDTINEQLEAEKSKLLLVPKVRQGYELGERLSFYGARRDMGACGAGACAALFGLLGLCTIYNTLADRRKKRKDMKGGNEKWEN